MEDVFELHGEGIRWEVKSGQLHTDSLEMAGLGAGLIVGYGVKDQAELYLSRRCIFPALRMQPNDTHASLNVDIDPRKVPRILVNGRNNPEYARSFEINGLLTIDSYRTDGLEISRAFYPASTVRACCERVVIKNNGSTSITAQLSEESLAVHSYFRGTKGVYVIEITHSAEETMLIRPGHTCKFHILYSARIANEKHIVTNGEQEWEKRRERVCQLTNSLTLQTGNAILDTMFRFAKIRAGESIFMTRSGLLHSPGGKRFYAATWCNDQLEYAAPWFGQTGDALGLEATMNAFRQYMPFMSDLYTPIPSSVISEGVDIWEGAGDRGDAAMYLYGASLFALFSGQLVYTKELWPAIRWCAEYCERRKNEEGVIASESDELEGRFCTDGKANLSTSCLCYGGLKHASRLAAELGEMELSFEYIQRADRLETAIEKYFGTRLHGFDTYRYSNGIDSLRSWICLPLCVGIQERRAGTLAALFSPYLWTENGLLTCERGEENPSETIWDRSTLYGFRSAFAADKATENTTWEAFEKYCQRRLLGKRVPYAVEAYPEAGMAHLSAESALFCRIITEGILDLQPLGLKRFSVCPTLPAALDHLYLTDIRAFGQRFSIFVENDYYQIEVGDKMLCRSRTATISTVHL